MDARHAGISGYHGQPDCCGIGGASAMTSVLQCTTQRLTGALLLLALAAPAWTAELEQMAIYVAGQEGYHTYRIPSLIVTKKGTVLAFCEGRRNNAADLGDIDLVVRRSEDGGDTWS